ncbi:hypothetical protein FHS43_002763 [Streptosporangium becharense]|uniref:Lipoprotein n=1 Tax=Streptosporangium becharense TaxID=1816182 RepID=A0A7W9IL61_9ACTN|nr:hypothetical protein [Streptosporangium becharense]MBB2911490.1 hypothetical protein [Streptosporangium becharense]MBB5822692.1 hypothetical protein [Streptosporangium becharense]
MSRSALGFPIRIVMTLLLAGTALSACGGKEPTAAEAGETLKTHVLKLLGEVRAKNITVTDPGGKDVPCGDGGAKRTFAATGQGEPPHSEAIFMKDEMRGAVGRVAKYTGVGVPDLSKPSKIASEESRTILVLDASSTGDYIVSGETECLSRS